jgi:mannose-6-phosphate isomerase-like protein (cupin superfamily)
MSGYTVLGREEAVDMMAKWPGFGEMRSYTKGLGAEQVALTWRSMPPGTGGKGSYGHRHKTQEEVYLVLSGTVKVKVGDEVMDLGPKTAIRVAPQALRSIHNDGPEEAELVIVSVQVADPHEDAEMVPDFWPET